MTKILLVDDDELVRTMYSEVLQKIDDFVVDTAADGNQALVKIAQSTPDIVILDIAMPELSGIKVLEIVKSDPKFEKIPIVMLTASSDYKEINGCLTMGASGYITKGERHNEVIDKIKMLVKLNRRALN
ncbi:MAG: response regulator [Candidatus Dadabacteria bacterium]|nr:response regulator [Candidatus Dadabacteria bacterium]